MCLSSTSFGSLLGLVSLLAAVVGQSRKIIPEQFLSTNCSQYKDAFENLVQDQLATIDPFCLDRVLRKFDNEHVHGAHLAADYSGGYPRLYVIDGELYMDKSMPQPDEAPTLGFGAYALPVLRQLTQMFHLPTMALLYSPYDTPVYSRTAEEPGPWFGYCGVPTSFNNLLLPSELNPAVSQCKKRAICRPGPNDTREGRAVFFGGATGWEKGRRRAVFLEAMKHPDMVYAGLTDYEVRPWVHYSGDSEIISRRHHTKLPLEDQVALYKYQIHVEGHCAACRLKYQLASPSAVMKVASHEQEWYERLLKPYVHYIPVDFITKGDGNGFEINLAAQVEWAEANAEAVEVIVRNANRFSAKYLSKEGHLCYSVSLLMQYAQLQLDPWRVRERLNDLELV